MLQGVKEFTSWLDSHKDELAGRIIPIKGTKKWVVLRCTAELNPDINGKIKILRNDTILCVEEKSKYAGHIYNSDSCLILFAKFAALAVFVRGPHAIISTAYHILGIGAAVAMVKGVIRHRSIQAIAKKALESLADIYRTPFYCALMGGAALAAAIVGPFHRPFLYECRAFTDDKLYKLYRNVRTELCCSPCMYHIVNIAQFEKVEQPLYPKINYTDAR